MNLKAYKQHENCQNANNTANSALAALGDHFRSFKLRVTEDNYYLIIIAGL
jgi:hypothetical protein